MKNQFYFSSILQLVSLVRLLSKKIPEKQINDSSDKSKVDLFYLDLLHFRPISNLMANDLNVAHQSPQAILIKNGDVKYSASHENIDFENVLQALK
ncbi:monothiol bacilliredoxin BrxC family protein [Halpernia sp. GG3]